MTWLLSKAFTFVLLAVLFFFSGMLSGAVVALAAIVISVTILILLVGKPKVLLETNPVSYPAFVLYFAALLAPSKALVISLFLLMNPADFQNPFFMYLVPERRLYDMIMGVSGIVFGIMVFYRDGFWRIRQYRQVGNLPTSKVRSLQAGLVELKGTARKMVETTSVPEGVPSNAILWTSNTNVKMNIFYLEDETGKVIVDPEGALIVIDFMKYKLSQRKAGLNFAFVESSIRFILGERFSEIVLWRHFKRIQTSDGQRDIAWLEDGDQIYIIGNAEIDELSNNLVVRTTKRAKKADLIYSPFSLETRKDVQDVFFISDSTSEWYAKNIMLNRIYKRCFWSLFWIILSSRLIAIAAGNTKWYG